MFKIIRYTVFDNEDNSLVKMFKHLSDANEFVNSRPENLGIVKTISGLYQHLKLRLNTVK